MKVASADRQQMILEFIEWYQGENQRPPTVREIQKHCEFKSPRAVTYFLEKLEAARQIIRQSKSRGIQLTSSKAMQVPERMMQIPLFSSIPAGFADPLAGEVAPETFRFIPSTLGISSPERAFAVRVRGESMIDAGIFSGDIVVLERKEARTGDIVAALLDGESTLKRLIKKGSRVYLKAENRNYPDLEPAESLSIQGVLVSVIRQFA